MLMLPAWTHQIARHATSSARPITFMTRKLLLDGDNDAACCAHKQRQSADFASFYVLIFALRCAASQTSELIKSARVRAPRTHQTSIITEHARPHYKSRATRPGRVADDHANATVLLLPVLLCKQRVT